MEVGEELAAELCDNIGVFNRGIPDLWAGSRDVGGVGESVLAGCVVGTMTVEGANHFLQVDGRVPSATVRSIAAFVSRA